MEPLPQIQRSTWKNEQMEKILSQAEGIREPISRQAPRRVAGIQASSAAGGARGGVAPGTREALWEKKLSRAGRAGGEL